MNYIDNKEFNSEDFSESFPPGEYDSCTFTGCNFTNASLNSITFSECEFVNCDLSNARISGATFREVSFSNCKLLGWRFDECNPFLLSFNFTDCNLSFSSFYKLKIKSTRFNGCKLEEVDFTEADLSLSGFRDSKLGGATFRGTNLEKCDFYTASDFSIDPTANSIRGAKFSSGNISGLLDAWNIIIKDN